MCDTTSTANIAGGSLLVCGGVAGYLRKQSTPSLIAGATSGAGLIAAGVLSRRQPSQPFGSLLGLTTASLLTVATVVLARQQKKTFTLSSPPLYIVLAGLALAAVNTFALVKLSKTSKN